MTKSLVDVVALRSELSEEDFAALRLSVIEAASPVFRDRCPFVPDEVFIKSLVGGDNDSLAVRRIQLYRASSTGRVVGYAVVRAAELESGGASYLVVDASGYIIDEFRGRGVTSSFFYREIVRIWLRALLRHRVVVFGICSPATYKMISKYTHEFYPDYRSLSSPAMRELLEALKGGLGYETLPGRPFVVRNEMWRRNEDPTEPERWRRDPSPHLRFYLEQCGDSGAEGSALLTVIPANLRNAVLTAGALVVGKARDRIRRLWRASPPRGAERRL
ncbi:MAG: hypothetical protein H6711_04615 [Myxococcales bacterium]|nr:hypothetical protein [Myxococcales bacterium]